MELQDICSYVKTKVETSNYSIEDYISTENMLPEKGGITVASSFPSGKVTEFQENDILISNIRPYFKKIWKADRRGCCSNDVLCIRANNNVDAEFLYYLLSQDLFFAYVMSGANGSKMPRGDKQQIMNWEIEIPSEKEDQRRIASILSSLNRKIELNNKINADLEEMAQAIFKNWFVDFEPFKDGKFVDSELGMIPEGWKVGSLRDMGTIVCGKTPSKANSNYYGGNIPFIKIPDMHGNVFVEISEDRLTEQGSLSQIKKLIPPYSLMVSCIATVGLVSINTKPSHTNQQINTIIPYSKSALFYLYQHIKNNEEHLKNMGRGGTTTLNVNTKSFSNIRLLIPSEIALLQFHEIVEGIFKKIELNMQESRTLSLLRDTLLPRLMSGELEAQE
ncbi:restriction endonuclease subunit S [Segatella copri]|jgi:type I restriction enzyme S subunit|uniref:Restriction endonuclease subunit S n=1 Tax=Segatella copri TaxID=165179 RepID=A0AA92U4C8_9BACT|nr:restriction endonuclease subunit S [Segatella copri]RGW67999.1 restriction endonuclease subunit S [Segatella copri]